MEERKIQSKVMEIAHKAWETKMGKYGKKVRLYNESIERHPRFVKIAEESLASQGEGSYYFQNPLKSPVAPKMPKWGTTLRWAWKTAKANQVTSDRIAARPFKVWEPKSGNIIRFYDKKNDGAYLQVNFKQQSWGGSYGTHRACKGDYHRVATFSTHGELNFTNEEAFAVIAGEYDSINAA